MEAFANTQGSRAALSEVARLTCVALERAPFPFAVVRLDGECVGANRALEDWAESSGGGGVVGRSLLAGDDGDLAAALARASLGDPITLETACAPFGVRQRGRYRVHLSPLRVGSMVCGASLTMLDLSEQRDRDDALREADLRFRAAVEAATDGVGVHRGGILLYVNPAALRMLGYDAVQEVIGRPIMDFVHAAHRDRVRSHIAGLAHSGEAPIREETFVRKDGAPVVVELSAARAPLQDGLATFVFLRDVTQRRRVQAEAEQAARMQSLTRFAGNVARQLGSRLAGIREHLSVARLQPEDRGAQLAALEAAGQDCEQAATMMEQLGTFSRGAEAEATAVDPNQAVREAVSVLERTGEPGGRIEVDLDPEVGKVWVGAEQLRRVVANLLQNAREAVATGGRIEVRTRLDTAELPPAHPPSGRAGRWAVITVEDTGVGMDAAMRSRVFEPLFSTKPAACGKGLGLSTAHGLVEQAGGIIEVDSELGKGSSFSVYLPRYEAAEVRQAPNRESSSELGAETVLVCDDESRLAMLTAGLLDQYGYGAVTVSTCEEALRVLARDEPRCAVVLLDVSLPDGSASAVLERMHAAGLRQPVILTSGYAPEDVPAELMADPSVAGYLAKPYSVDRLVQAVRAALDKSDDVRMTGGSR